VATLAGIAGGATGIAGMQVLMDAVEPGPTHLTWIAGAHLLAMVPLGCAALLALALDHD
jgi:hypothetical protein